MEQPRGMGAIVRQAAAGDEQAFQAMVEATHHDLRCFVAAHAWHVDLIDEVVQTTYVTCFRSLGSYHGGDALLPWLKGIARNHLRQELALRRQQGRHHPDRLLELVVPPDAGDGDEVPLARLLDCLAQLGPQARVLIDLFYRDCRSLAEIAGEVQRSRASVAMALSRIRAGLRTCLEEGGASDA